MHPKHTKFVVAAVALILLIVSVGWVTGAARGTSAFELVGLGPTINKNVLVDQLGPAIARNEFPDEFDLEIDGEIKAVKVEYTLNENAQNLMQKLLRRYQPDYAAFVAIDAKTGRILALASHSRVKSGIDNLALRATFPAASIFKIVTASAAIDLKKARHDTVVPFNGGLYTLYRKNLENDKINRWTRMMTMREAFARSVNMFFGKLGLYHVGPEDLYRYGERFLFNRQIPADIPVQAGLARFDLNDPWSVVSAASGFTHDNTLSPLHGALIAAAIANDGVMMAPFLIESLTPVDSPEAIYRASEQQASVVVDPQSAEELRVLFQETIRSGTSRKSFRQIARKPSFEEVEFGGKTGSLTGQDPKGKCDWFVGYARYRDQRIAVAALTVNEKKWRVKSSMLANLFFQNYLTELIQLDQLADLRPNGKRNAN